MLQSWKNFSEQEKSQPSSSLEKEGNIKSFQWIPRFPGCAQDSGHKGSSQPIQPGMPQLPEEFWFSLQIIKENSLSNKPEQREGGIALLS